MAARRRYTLFGALVGIVFSAVILWLLVFRSGDLTHSPWVRVVGARATVTQVESSPHELLPSLRPVGETYRIYGREQSRMMQLRFRVPRGLRLASDEVLMAATRSSPDSMWVLLPGSRRRHTFTVRTKEFSEWSLVVVKKTFTSATERVSHAFDELRGRRPGPPECPPVLGYHIEVEAGDRNDPLLYACPEETGARPAVTVYSNRALALEFRPPQDATLNVSGGSLSEDVWSAINGQLAALGGHSGDRLLPGGGVAQIVSDHLTEESSALEFRPTNQALATEILVLVAARASGGAIRSTARLAAYASCVHEAAGALGEDRLSAQDWLSLWGECGSLLGPTPLAVASAIVAGAIRTGQGVVDQLDLLARATVRLRRSVQRLLPLPGPAPGSLAIEYGNDGFPAAIGPFDVAAGARTLGDAIEAFGEPSSISPRGHIESGCETIWKEFGLTTYTASFGATGRPCGRQVTFVQTLVIDGQAFETDRGLRVGDSLEEMLSSYPGATTKGTDDQVGYESAYRLGDLYTLEVPRRPFYDFVTTLQAVVRNGRVRVIEVTPLLAGD